MTINELYELIRMHNRKRKESNPFKQNNIHRVEPIPETRWRKIRFVQIQIAKRYYKAKREFKIATFFFFFLRIPNDRYPPAVSKRTCHFSYLHTI